MASTSTTAEAGLLKIGDVCDRVGLSVRTVRYYEEVGLLTPTGRTPGGFRLYSEADVARLCVLKGMKPLGLTLDEIRELMELLDVADAGKGASVEATSAAVARLEAYTSRARSRVEQLEAHVVEVQKLRDRMLVAVEDLGARRVDTGASTT